MILTENDIDEAALHSAINATGYEVKAVTFVLPALYGGQSFPG